jgi:hypothetical protein
VELSADTVRPRFLGYAGNLSTTGVFIQSLLPRAPGTRLEMRLHLPDRAASPLLCVGEVVWTRAYRGIIGGGPGMGVRFLEASAAALQALERVTAD